ncbi:MAG: glucan biosynthesis protein [Pseudomonadota bacterium]
MIDRRAFLGSACAALALTSSTAAETAGEAGAESFEALARALSRAPHRDPAMRLAAPFDTLTYDSFRAIRPAEGGAAGIPLGEGLSADLLPPGFYFRDRVAIDIEEDGVIRPRGFDPALFTYGERYFDGPPVLDAAARAEMGFSGLRIRAPYRHIGVADEFFVTQGASYFRAVSRDTLYGLSNRALALGTGGPDPEEFPLFTRLRLREAVDGSARLEALIESPSVTGAATLTLTPGEPTLTDVDLVLFPRVRIADVGIAPLTSMYLKGPLRAAVSDDFRPRVHDSDALRIANGSGELLWRPLSNPARLQSSSFADPGPRGFGLIQSPRGFDDFEDPEAAYHRRPSAWVEPRGAWGAGQVMLVEIPTEDEFFDNIVAFWRPAQPLEAGGAYRYSYRIHTGTDPVPLPRARAEVRQSRSGLVHDRPGQLQYIVDFEGAALDALSPVVRASAGQVHGVSAFMIAERGHLRVGFRFEPADAAVSELRLVLADAGGTTRSDVWLHRWTPGRDGGL